MVALPFTPSEVVAADAPLIRVRRGFGGRPVGATAAIPVEASRDRLWAVITDLRAYADRIPMMDKVDLDGDLVTVRLRFRVAIISVTFSFTARASREAPSALELSYVSGEPADLSIRFDLEPVSDDKTVLYATIGFDIDSLGWLVKTFLKHHPEIRYGVFTGSAFALADKMREAAERP